MPNFQPSSVINFTGSIAGSPAATVASNAVSGLTAFNDTTTFRDPVIPNGTLSVFSPNSGTATQDGNVVVNIDYTYNDGARVADYYIIFYKQGGGTVSPSNPCIIVNPSSGAASSARINVVPGSPYTFAFSSARVTKDGVRASSPQNQTARTIIAGNYTANIAGISASSIASAGKTVVATIDKQAINYSVTGAATPTSINITATTQNITNPFYTFYVDAGAGFSPAQTRSADNSLSSYTFIPPVNTAYQYKVDAHEGNVATVAASDFVTVYGLASGSNALTTIMSNESHSIPADSTGSPTSYAGSGTTIRLYEGATELTYVASAPAAGQWTVIASPTNITTGSLTATSGYLTVGNHSAITSSTASIDYNISGSRQNGTAIPSFKKIQSLVRTNAGTAGTGGSPAQYIVVTGDQAFRYSSDSTTSVPAQITLSAELYGGLTTYDWQYYNTTNSAWSPASVTTQTYTVSPATPGFTGNSFRVRCVSGSFTDETTLVKLFDGTNAKVGYLTNEAFVSTTNASGGSPVYDGGNGVFKVFNGITDISTGAGTSYGILNGTGTPSPIASVTRNGLTLAIGASTGIYSPSGTAWSTNSESFTLRATTNAANGSVVIDKVYNIAKSRAGSPGAAGLNGSPGTNVATVYLYQRTTTTASPTMPADPITYTFSTGGINSPNTGWFSAIPSFTGTNPYLWVTLATASNSASTDTINSNEWQAAKLLSQNGTDGSPGAAGFSTAVLTAYIRSAFAPSTTPGTIVYTFSSSAWTPTNGWSKTIPSANGLPLWAVSATAFSTDPTDTVNSGDWSTPTKVLIDPTSAIGGNLITQSENLSAWTFGSASVSPGILYLDGSTQFWKVYENTTTSAYHDIIAPTPFPSISVGDRVTLSANVMKGERVRHVMYLATDPWSPNNWPLSTFDLSAGLVLSNSATVADAGIFEVGNIGASKVYRIYITTVPATVAASTYPLLRTSLDDGTQLYASASPGSGFYATRVQLSKGYLAEYLKTDTTTIQNNAAVGDAFTGTTELRVKTAPSNNATIGSITSAATADGNSVITVPITYTQSPAGVLADGVIVYYKEGPTGANSPANDHKGFSLDTTDSATTRNVQFTLKPSQEYNFSVRAYRRAEGGRKYTTFSAVSTHTSTSPNYTGLIAGSPAATVRDNANNAFTGTTNYRQNVSPSSDPSTPTITQSATADGNIVAKVAYTYSPGSIPADFILIYAKENGGTISPAVQSFATNAVTGDLSLVLKPSTTYRFAAQAVRRTESGIKGGNIISTADIALTSPNYTGLIAGSPAGNVAANAVSGATAFTGTVNYRQNSAPTNNATFGTISPSYTSDGNAVVNVPYSYTNGALPADFLIVYYKEGGGATVSPDNPGFSTNPSPGNLNFTLKPNTSYRFGIQAVRRTESGLVGTSILASSADTVLTAGNYTGNVNSVPASTVTTAVSNFNSSNDRNSTSPTTPTLTNTIADYAPIILNTDGTADIEFNWSYTNGSPLAANNVDGFIVYVQSFNYPNNYTFTGSETSSVVPVANTSSYGYTFKNLPAHQWHNMAVRAYRVVDSDIASPSILYSTFAKSTYNNTRGITSTAQFPVGQKTHTASSSPVWNNLFQFTDDYTSVNWIKVNAAVARSTTERAPDGRTFAWEMTDSGSTSPDVAHNIYQAITPTGPYCVFKCFVKQKTPGTGVNLRYGPGAFGGGTRNFQFEISPVSMTFPTTGNGHGSVRPLQNGWYEFITAYPVTSPNATNMQFMATRNLSVNYSGSPDIGNGLYFANLATYNVAGIIGVSPALPSTIDVVGSTWYDTVSRSLKIWDGSSWVENSTVGAIFGSSPSNLLGLSGDGENRIPQRYSGGFSVLEVDVDSGDRNKYPVFLGSPSKGSGISGVSVGSFTNQASFGDLGPASGYYGSYAIKIKFNGNTAGDEVYFASSPAGYNIQLTPNSKWIVSGKGWLSSPSIIPFTTQLGLLTAVNPTTGYRANSTISTRKTWTDLSGILNLTNDSSTLGTLVAGANITGGTGGSPYLWLDGLMLERKVGPGSTPTPWSKGSQYGVLGNSKGSALIPSSSIGVGQFFNGMTMNQGDGNARPIISGFYVATARDTDNIIFPTAYATLPSVIFFPGAQTTGSPFANTTNVSSVCEAQNLTTTGFTARIRFIGVASSTSPITDTVNFGTGSPSVLSPGSPDSAGYVGAPSPSIAINKTNGAEAFDDKYKYTFRVTVNNNFIASGEPYEPGNMDVGLYARKAAGWYLVSTQNIRGGTAGPSTSKTVSPTVTIDGVIFSPASGQAEFAIINLSGGLSGTVDSFQSVSYSVANPPTDVSATAAGSYPVPFAVIATSGSS
jgi:hypothetical protein